MKDVAVQKSQKIAFIGVDARLCLKKCWNSLSSLPYFTLLTSFHWFPLFCLPPFLHFSFFLSPTFLSSFFHFVPSFIQFIPSFIRFFSFLIPALPSFSRLHFLVFLSRMCILHLRKLDSFSCARLLPRLSLACFLYFGSLAAFTFARLLWLILFVDSLNGL